MILWYVREALERWCCSCLPSLTMIQGTQIWKLYHKTKGQLPNAERLENLSWRMMSMNLRRKEMERRQE